MSENAKPAAPSECTDLNPCGKCAVCLWSYEQYCAKAGEPRNGATGALCGHRFLSTCLREPGHEPPHRDASGNEWRGVESEDFR